MLQAARAGGRFGLFLSVQVKQNKEVGRPPQLRAVRAVVTDPLFLACVTPGPDVSSASFK